MPVTQAGALNTTALITPDLYVQIIPPANQYLNGVPTNILGLVGTATWGPVNTAVTVGNLAQAAAIFGPQQNRAYDLSTYVAVAMMQGANNFRLVRVTDGTDVAASIVVLSNCITFTSKYTGTFGNSISVTVAPGTAANTQKVTVSAPGLVSEAFDNIGSGLSGNALWVAIANAINNGTTVLRGPSQIIVATAGAGTTAPTAATYTPTGGTDGVTTITTSVLIGQDTVPRKGLYCLRNTGCAVAAIPELTDTTSWATQIAFGLSEGVYMIMDRVSGDTISTAVTAVSTAGVDSYIGKIMFGDWIYWLDTVNNVTRLLAPSGFVAGQRATLAPHLSGLNRGPMGGVALQGIVGTQRSYASSPYASADIQSLILGRLDVITNPVPGGNYFALRSGHNCSSNAMTNTDNYTTLTNYIAYTLSAGMGKFVGQLHTATLRQQALATVSAFLQNLQGQGMIGDPNGGPAFSVEVDANNNPTSRISLGYLQADVQVKYLATVEKFLINVQGGSSVSVSKTPTPSMT